MIEVYKILAEGIAVSLVIFALSIMSRMDEGLSLKEIFYGK